MASHFEYEIPDLKSLRDQAVAQGDGAVLSAVNQNTELLQQLFDRLQQNSKTLEPETTFDEFDHLNFGAVDDDALEVVDENIRLREENSRLNRMIDRLESEVASLRENNQDLATKVVYGGSEEDQPQDVSTQPAAAIQSLSWEERKQQIIEQMENDSFDAEAFLTTLDIKRDDNHLQDDSQQAIDYVIDLNARLEQLRAAAKQDEIQAGRYQDEIQLLKNTVQDLEAAISAGAVIESCPQESFGEAEAVAEQDAPDPVELILDADEIVQQERAKLAQLQQECEQKLRDIEIQTSLERAKLSRERSELEQQNKALQAQVEALQRSAGANENGRIGTRWMAKLGLTSGGQE